MKTKMSILPVAVKRSRPYGLVLRLAVSAASCFLLITSPCFGAGDEALSLVGAGGELLQLQSGTYGQLFPEGAQAQPESWVLALDSIAGGRLQRHLVPGTESPWPEGSARLIADERAGVSYLLWESRINGVHPLLKLVAFDGRQWGTVKEIAAGVFATKGEPQLRVTHDSYGEGGAATERTVLHVSWWEDNFLGKEKRYASLILENGEFIDANAIVDLSGLLSDGTGGAQESSPFDLLIQMQAGPQKDIVIMGFADPGLRQLVGVQVEVLPQALSRLSDSIKAELLKLPSIADQLSVQAAVERAIDEQADEFHTVGLELIRQDLLRFLQDLWTSHNPNLPFAEKMGGRVIWIGAKIGRTGLENPGDPTLLEIHGPEGASHHIAVTRVASWEIPWVGESPHLFLSRDGNEALAAWMAEDGEAIHYRMTESEGLWGDVQSLQLWEGFDQAKALELLEKKAMER